MSFVVTTGAPSHFYLYDRVFDLLLDGGRIKKDVNGIDNIQVFSRITRVDETPENHQPANIIGLAMIGELHGISLGGSTPEGEFRFGKPLEYF